jgi:CheY-like chemotaxis protein
MKPAPRIAVVDDELIVAKDLESTLRGFGYEVSGTAPSAREAIALAGAAKPDLMLMDIRLSGEMDGIEAARHIQCQHDVPIVFVTAYADDATLARAREAYPYGYLVKPVQDNALRSTVTTALHRHRAERQARQTLDRQRALCDALGHLLWTAQADGRAETFNQRWFDYTGLSAAASRGFGWVTALHPADMRRCLNQWREAVARKAGFELVCTVMRAGNAGGRRHLLRVVALPDAPGEPQWLATLTDIHDYEKRSEASRLSAAGGICCAWSRCRTRRVNRNGWRRSPTFTTTKSGREPRGSRRPACRWPPAPPRPSATRASPQPGRRRGFRRPSGTASARRTTARRRRSPTACCC